ncbi:Sulfoacetaldehyde reductase [Candidatus Rubidus massiliensis]|nr:Sulfoacetaldehyde reductase [Candidatus Rubidus massiliensis]
MNFKKALITGASSGIGHSLATLMAKKNISLIITGRNNAQLVSLKDQLSDKVPVEILVGDLENPTFLEELLKKIESDSPDLIINNAGFGLYGDTDQIELAKLNQMIDVNIKALMAISIAGVKALKNKNQKGTILNISSAASFLTFPSFSVYAATKAFINSFSQSLDVEVQPFNIRVLTSCPGMVETNFSKRAGAKKIAFEMNVMTADKAAELMWEQIEKQKPLSIINWQYKLAIFLSKFVPKFWLAKRLQKNIQARQK